jgi:hypothetical protein
MSHRMPATVADRHIDRLLKAHPEIMDVDAPIDSFSPEGAAWVLRASKSRGYDLAESAIAMSSDPTYLLVEDVALWSRWRTCRHVYHFDKDLTKELSSTQIPGSMPTDSLRMLPYEVIFVEADFSILDSSGDSVQSRGFFVWRDRCIGSMEPTSYGEAVDSISMMFVHDDRPRAVMSMNLELDTLDDMVSEIVAFDRREYAHVMRNGGLFRMKATMGDYEAATRSRLQFVISHLLYIIADNSDQDVEYRPSGNSRRKGTCKSTIHAVGTRIGKAIGSAKVRYVGKSDADGNRTVRPHMRAAHWHHFWTGPRDKPDKRKLIVRWIMPTFVNGGIDDETVTHAVRKVKS